MRILGSAHHRTRRAFVVSRAFVLGLFDRSFRARRRVAARTRHAPAVARLRVRFVLNHAVAFRRSSRHGSGFTRASKRRIARRVAATRRLTSRSRRHTDHHSNRDRVDPRLEVRRRQSNDGVRFDARARDPRVRRPSGDRVDRSRRQYAARSWG